MWPGVLLGNDECKPKETSSSLCRWPGGGLTPLSLAGDGSSRREVVPLVLPQLTAPDRDLVMRCFSDMRDTNKNAFLQKHRLELVDVEMHQDPGTGKPEEDHSWWATLCRFIAGLVGRKSPAPSPATFTVTATVRSTASPSAQEAGRHGVSAGDSESGVAAANVGGQLALTAV